jgi:hypothetical protein
MTWTGSAGDKSWHTAGNWDPAQVPVDGDIVTIPDSSIVEYSSGETSVRLNCAGHLTVSGGTLKLGFGNSILTSGKLDGSGDIVTLAHGELFWNGGSIEGTGNLIVNNGSILTTKASASLDRYLVNNGSLLMTGNLRLTGGAEGIGTFPIQAGQILELSSGSYDLNSLNVNNSGTLRISNTCTFARFNYDFTQQNKGTLEFAIGGPDDFTKLEVAKRATLYGVLKINILDGYVPQAGDTFEIITYSSRTGKFSSIESNVPEITFEPTYSNTGLTLTVIDEKATVWEVANDTDLENALNGFRSGDTIELTSDFTYRKGIVIDGKDITFDTGGFTLNVYNYTEPSPGVGLEVKNGGNVYLIGSGQLYIRQIGGTTSYGVKVTGGSTATVTNVEATGFQNDVAFGVYADGTGSSIQVLGNVHVMAMSGCGAKTGGHGRITVDGTITAMNYINIDAAEIGKNVDVHIPIVGQVKEVLQAINKRLDPVEESSEWHKIIDRWKAKYPLRYGRSGEGRIMPQHVVEKISELTQGEAIITTEVGQNQMWAAHYYKFKNPRSFITSGGLGTMGFGLPAAIGAKIACPHLPVIDIAGDGSIQMNIQELGTAIAYQLPVIVCILNNQYLGMVRQWQSLFYGGRFSHTDISVQPDFVKLAEAYGAVGMRVKDHQDVDGALREALQESKRPVVIDFWVDRMADVYPMVAPGESLLNMLGEE